MIRKFNKGISFILLMTLLAPMIILLEHHHHDHFVCQAKDVKHFHVSHEKCTICSYEFSVYASVDKHDLKYKVNPFAIYPISYQSAYYSSLADYSFQLRAPPVLQI